MQQYEYRAEAKNNIRTGVLALTLANLAVKVLGFAYKVPLNALLGNEMANVNAALALFSVLYTASTAGIPGALSLSVSRARAEKDGGKIRALFDVTLSLLLGVGFFLALGLLFLARPLSHVTGDDGAFLCILSIAPALFFIAASSVFRGFFQGFSCLTPTAVSELFEAVGKTVFGVIFAYLSIRVLDKSKANGAALAVFGVTLGIMLGTLYLAFTYQKRKNALLSFFPSSPKSTVRRRTVYRTVFSLALPITAGAALMSLSALVDAQLMRPLLTKHYGSEALAKALYSDYSTGALTLYNLPSVLITPIAAALVPYASGALAQGERQKTTRVIQSSLKICALLSLPCAFGMAFLSRPILSFVFRTDADMAQNAGASLSVLSIGIFLAAIVSISTAALQTVKKERLPIVSLGIGILVKIFSMPILVRFFGTVGVPLATVGFYLVATVLNLIFLFLHTKMPFHLFDLLLRPLLCGLGCGLLARGAYLAFLNLVGKDFSLLFAIILGALFYFLLVLLLGALKREELLLLPFGKKITKKWGHLFEKG